LDGRKNNGGKRKGAGRKSRVEEEELIQKLDSLIDPEEGIKALKDLIIERNINAVKLYFEYRFGKPKQITEIDLSGESKVSLFQLPENGRG